MLHLNDIRLSIVDMAKLALKMLQDTFRTFMEHDLDLLSSVLKEEDRLNALERELTTQLAELGGSSSKKYERLNATIYMDIVGDLEMIGDYCKDILERVQIKIEERLLFSEDAVKEYKHLYQKTEAALRDIVNALERNELCFVKQVLKNEKHIDGLIEKYRQQHMQRLIEGICSPLAGNMFLNMLDFTGQIFHHTKSIASDMLKLK